MNSGVKSFLTNLQEINDANIIKIKIPSTGKNASFKLASVSQQKQLLRSAFDGVDGVLARANILNNIIIENSIDAVDFLITDKNPILIGLRKESIGSAITIKGTDYDLNDLPELNSAEIKLTDTIKYDDITVEVKVPTISDDIEINTKLSKELAKFDDQEEKLKQSVGIVLAYETSKYIHSIELGENKVIFDDISTYERKEIVNNLPIKLSNSILDYISSVKTVTDEVLTFSDEVMVEIDASFLSND